MAALLSIFFLLVYAELMTVLSYLMCSLALPLVDSSVVAFDHDLGFYAQSFFFWFKQHRWWDISFILIYDTFLFQMLAIVIFFILLGELTSLQRFIMQFMLAALLAVVISGLLPAAGVSDWYHYTPNPASTYAIHHFYELRQGILDVTQGDGIVELPSFHTTMALIYAYALRHQRKIIFIPVLILNCLMVFSCIPVGDHYLADILAGIVLFAVVIGLEQLIFLGVKKYGTEI